MCPLEVDNIISIMHCTKKWRFFKGFFGKCKQIYRILNFSIIGSNKRGRDWNLIFIQVVDILLRIDESIVGFVDNFFIGYLKLARFLYDKSAQKVDVY